MKKKPHGGARKGAGRKPKEPTVVMRIPKSMVAAVKKLLKKQTAHGEHLNRMKTGIELIAEERKEQIKKHGFTKQSDKLYTGGELVQAALCCLEKVGRGPGFTNVNHKWPAKWNPYFEHKKIRFKDDIGKLTVAGAFYMAENDRLGNDFHQKEINQIAAEIDRLQNEP